MVVGDSQWLGAGSTGGHYVDLTDFFKQAQSRRGHGPGDGEVLRRVSRQQRQVLVDPARGRRRRLVLSQGLVRGPEGDGSLQGQVRLRPRRAEGLSRQLRDIAEFFYRPDEKKYGVAIYTDNSYDAMAMGVENALFSYGGELGDYTTYKVDGIINSDKAVAALEAYKELYTFTPPGWAKAFFVEDNQAITENLAAMSMNYFAFFPSLINEATNPQRQEHRLLRQPARARTATSSPRSAARASRSSPTRKNQEEALKFLEWFIKDETQKKWAELGGYTCSAAVLKSDEFQNATPYNKAFYETMFKVKDFWAMPEYAELLQLSSTSASILT